MTNSTAPTGRQLNELGFYLLGGAPEGPADILREARRGEELGLGTGFISERWNVKEAASLTGAACAVTDRMHIATAATNHNTRHPLIAASWATTMHRLSGGRFTLGIGRGVTAIYQAFGLEPVTTAQMRDWAQLMRRLWRGETIVNHDGPAGAYRALRLDSDFDEDIPLAIVAFGPNTLTLGGQVFDDVILHTYFTQDTLHRAVTTVKKAAEQAGRDPDQVRVWSCFATIGDHLPEELRLKKSVARLATYLQYYGDLMVATNEWDPAVLTRFRQDRVVASFAEPIDGKATTEQIAHIAELLPEEWLEPSATGSPEHCVTRIRREFEIGADRVILHGANPDELEPILAAYRADAGTNSEGCAVRITGSRVLITGASRGIGQSLAAGFAAAGADVALVARGADTLERLAGDIGGRAYPCDLTDRAALRTLLARVERDGPVDILVNNAADECIGRFTDMSADTLEFMLALNALAPAELTRQALPGMLTRGRGHVVNVSSFAGIVVPPMLATYAATKAFLSHHSVNLQFELKDTPIGVTRVEIGEVAETGLMDKGRTEPALAAMFDRMYRLRLGRLIRPEEITTAVLTAVRDDLWSVRLPRRLSPASLLADVPRRLPWLLARGLTTPPTVPSTPA